MRIIGNGEISHMQQDLVNKMAHESQQKRRTVVDERRAILDEVLKIGDDLGFVTPVPPVIGQVLQQAEPKSALGTQVGGNHYKDMVIQPLEFAMANNLDPCQFSIVKYVSRFRSKNGLQDLEKARHFLDLLIEFEYGKDTKT